MYFLKPTVSKASIYSRCRHIRKLVLYGVLLSSGMRLYAQDPTDPNLAPGSRPLEKRRILFLLPDYETIEPGGRVAPLSVKQKFQLFAGPTLDPSLVVEAAALAGIQQAANWSPDYGQGGKAYAQRLGAISANIATGSFFSNALLPTVFHQDPRYFKKGTGGVGSRVWYAVTRTFITRQDSGKSSFNYSQIGGLAASTACTNLYYPTANRTAAQNAAGFAIGVGVSAIWNVVTEFSPSRNRKHSEELR
jgi:hypothetical protein